MPPWRAIIPNITPDTPAQPLWTPEDAALAAHPERAQLRFRVAIAENTNGIVPLGDAYVIVAAMYFQVAPADVTRAQRASVFRAANAQTALVSGEVDTLRHYFMLRVGTCGLKTHPLDATALREKFRAGISFAFAYYDPDGEA